MCLLSNERLVQWRRGREVPVQILLAFFVVVLLLLFCCFFPLRFAVGMAAEMLEQWGHVREVCGSIPR